MTTAQPITVRINRATPSGNKSTGRGHWREYGKERDIWMALMRAQLRPIEKPTHRVSVAITSFRIALCDRVNFQAGCKCILDNLTRLGYLFDDSEEWLDDTYEQVKCPRVLIGTVIRIQNP